MQSLALVYYLEGKYAEAEALFSQTLEMQRRVLGPEHPNTLISMGNLAMDYSAQGKYTQAEALFSQTLEVRRRILGPEHSSTLSSMHNLVNNYLMEGNYAQAEALFSQTLDIQRRVLGPEHPDTLLTLSDFADIYQRQGKYVFAETHAAEALAGRRHALGSEHADTMASAADVALAYLSQGKFAESEPLAREAVGFYRKKQPEDWERFRAESLLGASLSGEKKYAEAEPLLVEGYQDVGTQGPDRRTRLVSTGPRPRMACATLSSLGQAGEGCRVEEKVRYTKACAVACRHFCSDESITKSGQQSWRT